MKALQWIVFISKRFSKVDRKGRTAVTSWLASVGVCFGVMALTVIMAVMNGFQMSFIDSIMEISSYHIRVSNLLPEEEKAFFEFCNNNNKISCVVPFSEAQGLMVSKRDCQTASLVRSVPENIMQVDSGFKKELKITSGKFDLSENDSIVIGNTIAYNLGLRKGSKVNIAALSGSSDTALLSLNRIFTVKGIFYSGYADINASYSFINSQAGEINFGRDAPVIYGIKLKSTNDDMLVLNQIKSKFNDASVVSWRDFNRSFFGVLRMEKNILFFMVLLIFVVVAINIYNAFKKLVYERKQEIAILSAFGGSKNKVRSIFLVQGFKTGALGAGPGIILGIFASKNISAFFNLAEVLTGNPMFLAYAAIPSRLITHEVILIFLFGLFSSMGASWLAGRSILKMTISEVLRDE